jgi:hypothetical protein
VNYHAKGALCFPGCMAIQAQNASRLGRKIRIPRKKPKPGIHGRVASACSQRQRARSVVLQQRPIVLGRQLASQGLNPNDEIWGKKPGSGPDEHALRTRPSG